MHTFEEKLLYTVKKDDLKSFKAMMRDSNLGNLRMGRFPVLSLLYLYGARKILSAYETGFLKISSWESVGEPIEVSQYFAKKAGKCLRLYFDETVSPIEMLLILDKTRRVKKAYPVAKPSEAVRKRLKSIYSIKYALNVSYRGTDIVLDRRPLSRREKRRLALACIGCLLILAIVIAVPATTVPLLPDLDAGEATKLKHIDFSSRETYTVIKDIVIPEDYSVDRVDCSFKGGGGRLIFLKGATLGQFNGKLEDIEICTAGSPIFEACTNVSSLENVTINVDADVEVSSDTAFVAVASAATFKNVNVNVRGRVKAVAGEVSENETTSMSLGGIVAQNMYAGNGAQRVYGTLENCSVNLEDLRLEGELNANASFGGLVGENYGIVRGCSVTGSVSAHTVDLGGACYLNANELTDVTCTATLTQMAEDENWTSVVGGIAIENDGEIEGCVGASNISATSAGGAICGGIAARSSWNISLCAASGSITVNCAGNAICGGVLGSIEIGVNEAQMSYYVGLTSKCLSTCTIAVTAGGKEPFLGGVVGIQKQAFVMQPVYDKDGKVQYDADGNEVTEKMYFSSPVFNCIFMGSASGDFAAVGSIIGGCGKSVYDKNSYFIGDERQVVFDGNAYLSGSLPAFGALFEEKIVEEKVPDKGATDMSRAEIEASDLYKEILARLSLNE